MMSTSLLFLEMRDGSEYPYSLMKASLKILLELCSRQGALKLDVTLQQQIRKQ